MSVSSTSTSTQRESWWRRSKTGSKAAFDKGWAVVDKLGRPVNRLTNKIGSESFWPTTLDKESEKAARILRSFCKDGFYDEEIYKSEDGPSTKQRVVKKIPTKVIENAKGLAIFTTMRTGLWLSGAGGSGVVVARKEDGSWSQPIGIMLHTAGLGFLVGVDIYDCVLVLNTQAAVDAFSTWRTTIGGEISAVAGPVGAGAVLESEVHARRAPIFTYLKSRGFYAGVQIDGTVVIERSDENERFYGARHTAKEILAGKAQSRDWELRMLKATLKAAQGDSDVDNSLLPVDPAPADYEIEDDEHQFGIPDKDDPDPFGVLALERAGMEIREAGTQELATPDHFEFKPSVHSPVQSIVRMSTDTGSNRSSLLGSSVSRPNYVTSDVSTQTDFDGSLATNRGSSIKRPGADSESATSKDTKPPITLEDNDTGDTTPPDLPRRPNLPLRRGPPPPLPPRERSGPKTPSPLAQHQPSPDPEEPTKELPDASPPPSGEPENHHHNDPVPSSKPKSEAAEASEQGPPSDEQDHRRSLSSGHISGSPARSEMGSPGPEVIENGNAQKLQDKLAEDTGDRVEPLYISSAASTQIPEEGPEPSATASNYHDPIAVDDNDERDGPVYEGAASDLLGKAADHHVESRAEPTKDAVHAEGGQDLKNRTQVDTVIGENQRQVKDRTVEQEEDDDDESDDAEEVEIVEVQEAVSPQPMQRVTPQLLQQARMVNVPARLTPRLPNRNPSRLRVNGESSDAGSIRSFDAGSPLMRQISHTSTINAAAGAEEHHTEDESDDAHSVDQKRSDTSVTTMSSQDHDRAERLQSLSTSPLQSHTSKEVANDPSAAADDGTVSKGGTHDGSPEQAAHLQGLGLSLPEPRDAGPRVSLMNIRGGLARHDSDDEDDFS